MSTPLPENMRLRLEWDSDPDLSWLDVERYRDDPVSIGGREISAEEYCDPSNHETYVAFLERTEDDGETWEVVDCVGGVDLWAPTSRVTIGTYEEVPDDLEFLELWQADAWPLTVRRSAARRGQSSPNPERRHPMTCYCGQCGPIPAGVKPHPCKGGFSPRKMVAALVLSVVLSPLAARAVEPCKVNVNTASPAQLALLINTGPALASKIEAARTAGPLDAAKLDAVSGIGPKWIERNTPHVAYSGETTCTEKLKKPAAMPEGGTDGPKPEAAGSGQ